MRDYSYIVRDNAGRFASTPGSGSSRKTVHAKRSVSRAADANRATRAKKAANPATDRRLNRESEQLGNRAIAARPTQRRAKPLTGEAVYATRGTANTPWPGQPRRNYDSGSQRSDTRMGRDAARRDIKRQNQVLSADTGKAAKAPKPKKALTGTANYADLDNGGVSRVEISKVNPGSRMSRARNRHSRKDHVTQIEVSARKINPKIGPKSSGNDWSNIEALAAASTRQMPRNKKIARNAASTTSFFW